MAFADDGSRATQCNRSPRPLRANCDQCPRGQLKEVAPVSDSHSPESENRQATVMFADIAGFTALSEKLSPEEVTDIMNDCFAMMEQTIKAQGGTIDKFIGDCVMAVFGVPTALENAPVRAIKAALEIRKRIGELRAASLPHGALATHIGINSGPVLAGEIGGEKRRDFTVMGDTVNLASRLEGVAQRGQIIIGPDTYRSVRNYFQFRAMGPIKVKGKEDPVPAVEVLGENAAGEFLEKRLPRLFASYLIGRSDEVTRLRRCIKRCVAHRGSVVSIVGEPGMGKTRLAEEVKSLVRDPTFPAPFVVLEGDADPTGRNVRFGILHKMLRGYFQLRQFTDSDLALQRIEEGLCRVMPDEDSRAVAPIIATILGLSAARIHDSPIGKADGKGIDRLILKGVSKLITSIADTAPLLLILEDLHWADLSSIELFRRLFPLAESRPIAFLVTFRPGFEEITGRLNMAGVAQVPGLSVEINLQPLSDEDALQLAEHIMKGKRLSVQIENVIKRNGAGNPYFITELLHELRKSEGAKRSTDRPVGSSTENGFKIPSTITDLLMTRIDRLDNDANSIIKAASVIGGVFSEQILRAVVQNNKDLTGTLRVLCRSELLIRFGHEKEHLYAFRHALLQEVAYKSLTVKKRKELHSRVAETLLWQKGTRLDEICEELSFHLLNGLDPRQAEVYMERAGRNALRANASFEAVSFYKQILNLYIGQNNVVLDRVKCNELYANMALAYYRKGYYRETVHYVEKILPGIATRPGSFPDLRFVRSLLSVAAMLFILPSRRKVPSKAAVQSLLLMTIRLLSLSNIDIDRVFREGVMFLRQILHYRLGDLENGVEHLATFAQGLFWTGRFALAEKLYERIEKEVEKDRLEDSVDYEMMRIQRYFLKGSGPVPFNEFLLSKFQERAAFPLAINLIYFYGVIAIEQGDNDALWNCVGRLGQIEGEYENVDATAHKHDLLTRYNYKTRNFSRGIEEAYVSMANWQRIESEFPYLHILGYKIAMQISQGAGAVETGEIDKIRTACSGRGVIPAKYKTSMLIAQIMHGLSENQSSSARDGRGMSSLVKAMVKNVKFVAFDRPEAYRLVGTWHWTGSRHRTAIDWWQLSLTEGEKLGSKLENARTFYEIGSKIAADMNMGRHRAAGTKRYFLRRIGKDEKECIEDARRMFEALGLPWELARFS